MTKHDTIYLGFHRPEPETFTETMDKLNQQLMGNASGGGAQQQQLQKRQTSVTTDEETEAFLTPRQDAPEAPKMWSESVRDSLLFGFLAFMGVGFALSYVVVNWQHGQ